MPIDWEKFRVRLRCAGRSRWERGITVTPTHDKDLPREDHTLVQFWEGRGRLVMPKSQPELGPGVCLWMRPGACYDLRQDPDQPLGMTFIHFDLLDASGRVCGPSAALPPEVHYLANPGLAAAVAQRVTELVMGGGLGYAWATVGRETCTTATTLLTGLLMDLDRSSAPGRAESLKSGAAPERVNPLQQEAILRLRARLIDNPDTPLTVSQMARQLGYSRSHFSRLFRDVTGQSARLFTIHVRISRAVYLLLNSTLSIGEIADKLGYPNIYHFSTQFKQKTLLTPTDFRRRRGIQWEQAPGAQPRRQARNLADGPDQT